DPALDRLVVGQRVAVGAEQRLAGLVLELPLLGLCPALAEIALAVVEVEAADHPVAVEGDVVTEARRELRIGLDAVERAVELGRNRAGVLQIGDVRLDPARGVEAGEARGVGEMRHRGSSRCAPWRCRIARPLLRMIVCSTNDSASSLGSG